MPGPGQEHAATQRERVRLLLELGRPREALKVLYSLRSSDSSAELAELEGLALIRLDEHEDAVRALGEGLRLAPERAHLHYLKAFAERGRKNVEAARAGLNEALRLAPEEPVYLRASAELHSDQGAHLIAIEQARQAVRIQPNRAQNHVTLGFVSSAADRRDEARRCYEKALELDPEDSTAWNNLGCLDLEAGDTPQARERFRESLRLAPEGERARRNLDQTMKGRPLEDFARWSDWLRGLADELSALDELALLVALTFEVEEAGPVLRAALKRPGRARAFAVVGGMSLWSVMALVRLGGTARLVGAGASLAASLGGKHWLKGERQRVRDVLRDAERAFQQLRTDWLDGRIQRGSRDALARRLIERAVLELRAPPEVRAPARERP